MFGTAIVIAVIALLAYLKWWNVLGQHKLGEACEGRAGCRSFLCLAHERVGSDEPRTAGYCTEPCETDQDCGLGLSCVSPSATALEDLPALGRPSKLCERVH